MTNRIYGCGIPGCLVCDHRSNPFRGWRKREAERLRRLYPQPSALRRLLEAIEERRTGR